MVSGRRRRKPVVVPHVGVDGAHDEQPSPTVLGAVYGPKGLGRRSGKPDLIVESDVPRLDAVASWERELLLPLVNQLVETSTGDDVAIGADDGNDEESEERDR